MTSLARTRLLIAFLLAVGIAAIAAGHYFIEVNQRRDGAIESVPAQSREPAYHPSPSGPNCVKGCRCGNSCIDCSKRCRK